MPGPLETGLEQVVAALGKYYGAVSRDDFVSMLIRSGSSGTGALEVPDPTPGLIAARALMDVTEGGYTAPELVRALSDLVGGGSSENDIPGLVRICYEPSEISESDDRSGVLLREGKTVSYSRPPGGSATQGAVKGGEEPSIAYSIKHISGMSESSSTADGAAVSVNTGASSPGNSGVTFSVAQVFANRLSPASRDMGALTLFMNAIPTIEMSRAVPFIDVVLIQEGAATTTDAAGSTRISSLSLGQFFLGNAPVQEGTVQHTILTARDAIVAAENQRNAEFPRSRTDEDGVERTTASPIATAGMELFTTPQTLVNADEDHYELDEFAASDELQMRRQAPIIDKFRPLMSLKSMSLQVVGTGGMMSYKSGKMSLTVHDRSRLAEVSALVKPSRYGTTHLLIEYGWSHPDAPVHGSLGPVNSDNLYGSLIGALRVREKYQVVNSSFSFDDTGQVDVELSLSMLSNSPMRQVQIGLGLESVTEFDNVRRTTQMIQHLRDRLSATTAQAVFGEGDLLGALTSPQGAVAPLSREAQQQIRRVIQSASRGTQPGLRELGEALADLVGNNGRGGSAETLRNQMKGAIDSSVRSLGQTSDPFFVGETSRTVPSGAPRSPAAIRSSEYVSLGKVLATFVGKPLTASGYFKDVQIIFYNFNSSASYMAGRNIATFPVHIENFKNTLKRELDQIINMPVEGFINFMGTYFVSDPSSEAYGFTGMYGPRTPEDAELRQLSRQYERDDVAALNFQQEVLRGAYGRPSDSDLEFKQPTVSVVLESVPVRSQPDQTILRIHVTDAQSTSHATLQSFLDASSAQSVGLINTRALAVQESLNRVTNPDRSGTESAVNDFKQTLQAAVDQGLLEPFPTRQGSEVRGGEGEGTRERYRLRGGFGALKQFIMKTVPSVRYGEGSSGIISAKVTSMSDPALTTVNMQRQGQNPETPTGAREQGLPLSVAPVECSLETIGCPLWSFGQQLFIDFGTGTTVDSIYGVVGVDHVIGPGEFKSTVKLTPMNSYARYASMVGNLENSLIAISEIQEERATVPQAAPLAPRRRGAPRRGAGATGRTATPGTTETAG